MKFTESQLEGFAAPLSQTEEDQCKRAIGMVRDALKPLGFTDDNKPITALYEGTLAYSIELRSLYGNRKIKLFIQGSYANNTNVRTQSDVDIAVIQEETFRTHYRSGAYYPQSDADYGFVTVAPQQKAFKDEVQECLENKFGSDVERKNKSIKIHGNTYRKDADSVPCMRYRDYSADYRKDENNYVGGVVIFPDSGGTIINYPEQHIKNGKVKNTNTHLYYKKMVRIMKKMRYLMVDSGIYSAMNVSSFAVESLLWNIPDSHYLEYGQYRKVFHFKNIISYLKSHEADFSSYTEANGIKKLFPTYTDQTAMIRFLDDLDRFYEYD
jgi:hypothetical protein